MNRGRGVAAGVVAVAALRCGGSAFSGGAPQDGDAGIDDAAPSGADGVDGGADGARDGAGAGDAGADAPIDGDAGFAGDSSGPCGAVRAGDAPTFTREVCVDGGTFDMGNDTSPADDPNGGPSAVDATPKHAVTLHPFAVDAYEVTVARYRACVAAAACAPPGAGCTGTYTPTGHDDLPITCLAWSDATAFCAWDGARHLPSEAEWEYAARGADDRPFPWGAAPFDCTRAVMGSLADCPAFGGPEAVGGHPLGATPDLAFDLVGNVFEWTADWYAGYTSAPATDPTGAPGGTLKIVRGGAWTSLPGLRAFAYARNVFDAAAASPLVGFRCAR